jgi:hypothetical protein
MYICSIKKAEENYLFRNMLLIEYSTVQFSILTRMFISHGLTTIKIHTDKNTTDTTNKNKAETI